MNEKEKRIKIAELCGWQPCLSCLKASGVSGRWRPPTDDTCFDNVPDYFNDLNACHVMETYLSTEPNGDPEIAWFTEQEEYIMNLEILTKSNLGFFPEVSNRM